MRKILTFLLILVAASGTAFAKTKHHNDPVRNFDATCMENNPGNVASTGFNYNEYAFCDFPNVRRCARAGGAHWVDNGCERRMCADFPYDQFDSATMIAVPSDSANPPTMAMRTATCWKYECDFSNGYIKYNKTCISKSECLNSYGMAVSSDGKSCVSDNWCSDDWRDGYSGVLHDQITVGGCQEYRCKPGSCFRSGTDRTCVSMETGAFGGNYCTADGLLNTCMPGEYVGDNGGCQQGKIATMAQMRTCFDCPFEAGFRECIESNGAVRTKCNDSSATTDTDTGAASSPSGGSGRGGRDTNVASGITNADGTITCAAGTWLQGGATTCSSCPGGYYCAGGTFTPGSGGQGSVSCPTSHPNSTTGNKSQGACYTDCRLVDNAMRMTGYDYYTGTDTCSISACFSNYTISGNACVYADGGGNDSVGGRRTGGIRSVSPDAADDEARSAVRSPASRSAIMPRRR